MSVPDVAMVIRWTKGLDVIRRLSDPSTVELKYATVSALNIRHCVAFAFTLPDITARDAGSKREFFSSSLGYS